MKKINISKFIDKSDISLLIGLGGVGYGFYNSPLPWLGFVIPGVYVVLINTFGTTK